MRVRCYMRRIRHAAGLSIPDVRDLTGCAQGELSMFERGHSIPRDDQIERLRVVYGDPSGWWPPTVARALVHDIADCPGCGYELEPDAAANRRIHDMPDCRRAARTGARTDAVPPGAYPLTSSVRGAREDVPPSGPVLPAPA